MKYLFHLLIIIIIGSCSNSRMEQKVQTINMDNYLENEINYYFEREDFCFIEGIRLGESNSTISYENSYLNKLKNAISLKGLIETKIGKEPIHVICYLGKFINGNICDLKQLENTDSKIGKFSLSFNLNSKSNALIFQSIGFSPVIYRIGEMSNISTK